MADGTSLSSSACALPMYQLDANEQVLGVNPALAALLSADGPWPAPTRLHTAPQPGLTARLWRPPGAASRVLHAAEQAGPDGVLWGVVLQGVDAPPPAAPAPATDTGTGPGTETDALLLALAHELRGPLNVVIGFADVLENTVSPPLEGRQRDAVGHIARSGERLLLLIEGLLTLSRAQRDGADLRVTPCNPVSLWREVVATWAPELHAKDMHWLPWRDGRTPETAGTAGTAETPEISETAQTAAAPATPRRAAAEPLRALLSHLLLVAVRSQGPGTAWQARIDDADGAWVWQLVESPDAPAPHAGQWHDGHWALCLRLAQHSGAELRPQLHPGGRRGMWLRWPTSG